MVVTGSSPNAIGVRSFLAKSHQPTGEHLSLSLRFGMEWEAIDNLLVVRGGSYYEPSRFENMGGRIHGTAGFDVRLPALWDWRIGFSMDAANDYVNAGLGVGFWH